MCFGIPPHQPPSLIQVGKLSHHTVGGRVGVRRHLLRARAAKQHCGYNPRAQVLAMQTALSARRSLCTTGPHSRAATNGHGEAPAVFAFPGAQVGGRFITLRPSSLARGPQQFGGGQSCCVLAPIEAASPWAPGIGSARRGGVETRRWSCSPCSGEMKALPCGGGLLAGTPTMVAKAAPRG